MAQFEVFEDKGGEHRWRLRADNGEIVAQSEGYATRPGAVRGVEDVCAAVHAASKPLVAVIDGEG